MPCDPPSSGQNDQNLLLRGKPLELEFTHDDRLLLPLENQKGAGGEYRLTPIPNLQRTVSKNELLCQLECGPESSSIHHVRLKHLIFTQRCIQFEVPLALCEPAPPSRGRAKSKERGAKRHNSDFSLHVFPRSLHSTLVAHPSQANEG